jgi:biotin/methionine sulfoxide reductase
MDCGLDRSRWVQTASHWGAYQVQVRNDQVVGVRPFGTDPGPNALMFGMAEMARSSLRIDQPHVRKGYLERRGMSRAARGCEPFVPVSWDVALDLVEEGLRTIREEHGNSSIYGGSYGWASAGRLHHAPSVLKRFLGLFGGYVDKRGNHSFGAAMHVAPYVIGRSDISALVVPWRDVVDHAELVVMFGGMHQKNTQVDAGGAVHHENRGWVECASKRNIQFVNVSPLRDDVAATLHPEWVKIAPNSDTAMMLALAHTLISEGLHDVDFVHRYCVGFDGFQAYLSGHTDGIPKNAEWAAPLCGIDPTYIRTLARKMAASKTLVTVSWSVQRAHHGEQPVWALIAVASLLGQIGRPGRGFSIGFGAVNGNTALRLKRLPKPTLPLGDNPIDIAVPVGQVGDMLLRPGTRIDYDGAIITLPRIEAVYSAGGNPFHHNSNLNRFVEAWRKPQLVVVHEPWWNPAARYADIVLPSTTTLERNDILAADFQRHYLAMYQALRPYKLARNDFDVFAELAQRFGVGDTFTQGRGESAWLRFMYEEARAKACGLGYDVPDFDAFWERGCYEFPFDEAKTEPPLFHDFRMDPEAHPLRTTSGKIELYSSVIESYGYDDCPAHPAWLEPDEWLGSKASDRFALHLLSHQPSTRLHSQLDPSSLSRASKRDEREILTMHPADARRRSLKEADIVRVFNNRGAFLASLRLSEDIRPGVILVATGAWFDPDDPMTYSSLEKHGNPNVVTTDRTSSSLSQASASQTVLVEVELATYTPSVTAFDAPPTQAFSSAPSLTR